MCRAPCSSGTWPGASCRGAERPGVPNGVDLERFRRSEEARDRARRGLGLDDRTFCWLSVGSLRALKRHDLMVRAFETLEGEPLLAVAGEGDERRRLEGLVAASPAGARVAVLGRDATPRR